MGETGKDGANMENKLFHPTMQESMVSQINPDMLELCALILHDLGWPTQQGMVDKSVERLRWWVENKPEVFLKACATGLTVCLHAQK